MLTSFALILILGMLLGSLFTKIKLPSLIGMLLTGIILGPSVLNLIDEKTLMISSELRQLALIIILTRVGLNLDINSLKKVGRPAFLMSFVPACFEILACVFLAPKIMGISTIDAFIVGCVIAAVSPAVIAPRMIKLIDEGYGKDKNIPELILAGASIDDIFVIVLFTSATSLAVGQNLSVWKIASIPVSIIIGVLVGVLVGYFLVKFFKKIHIRDTSKVILILSLSFLLVAIEKRSENIFPFSGLVAIMTVGLSILKFNPILAKRLSFKYSKLWVFAEVILFVLVGATVDLNYALSAGFKAVILLFSILIFRLIGVYICLLKTNLNTTERLFCMISYIPKATVQAAIGGIPLSMGLSCGNIVLTLAVLSILIMAPIGALGIDNTYKKFLQKA